MAVFSELDIHLNISMVMWRKNKITFDEMYEK